MCRSAARPWKRLTLPAFRCASAGQRSPSGPLPLTANKYRGGKQSNPQHTMAPGTTREGRPQTKTPTQLGKAAVGEKSSKKVNLVNFIPSRTKNSKQDNPVFESPDGIRIQINRGGNKMQFIRDLCRNKKITPVQFRMLVPLVDTSNEGTDDDRSRWGKSWLSLPALAVESGCSKKAIQENMPKLEAAGIVKVTRDLDEDGRSKGGRSNVNEYWLTGWNRFGAVSGEDEKGEPGSLFEKGKGERGSKKEGARLHKTGRAAPINGERGAPDSTYLPNPELNPSTQPAASRRERLAGGLDVGSDDRIETTVPEGHRSPETAQARASNDNQPADDDWPSDIVDKFQSCYRKGGDRKKISKALDEIRREGQTNYRDILRGASNYSSEKKRTESRYIKSPENFLTERFWRGYQQDNRSKPQKRVAI